MVISLEKYTTRRFHVGERVGWNSEAGHVSGHITHVHTKPFKVNGYTHHASRDEPQYEIKSDKTDHIAYHKGSALHALSASHEAFGEGPIGAELNEAERPGFLTAADALFKDIEVPTRLEDISVEKLKKPSFEVIPNGTEVYFKYRGYEGKAVVEGVHKLADTAAETVYTIRPHHTHPGGPKTIHRAGKHLRRV